MRHSATRSGPAARWIAPSTPPPPSRLVFAALTIASTSSVVMSATQISSRVGPIAAVRRGALMPLSLPQCRFGYRPLVELFRSLLGRQVDGAPAADVAEMLVEEALRGCLAELAQPVEEFVVVVELAAVVERNVGVHDD